MEFDILTLLRLLWASEAHTDEQICTAPVPTQRNGEEVRVILRHWHKVLMRMKRWQAYHNGEQTGYRCEKVAAMDSSTFNTTAMNI